MIGHRARLACAMALLAALSGCGWVDGLQRQWIFQPTVEDWNGYKPGTLGQEDVWIPVGQDGQRLHAWWVSAREGTPSSAPTILYLHGARWNLTGSVHRIAELQRVGFNVLAIDFRGFGRSTNVLPSEETALEDAMAAWKWVTARVPEPSRRFMYGHSLGGAVATDLATRVQDSGGLVLESVFTSVRDMAERTAARHLPLDALITQRFDTLEKIGRVRMPVFIIHGTADSIVPVDMARRLYEAAPEPKRLFVVEGAGHRRPSHLVIGALHDALIKLACRRAEEPTQSC